MTADIYYRNNKNYTLMTLYFILLIYNHIKLSTFNSTILNTNVYQLYNVLILSVYTTHEYMIHHVNKTSTNYEYYEVNSC